METISPWPFLLITLLIIIIIVRKFINRIRFGKKIPKDEVVTDKQLKVLERAIAESFDPGWEQNPGVFSRVDRDPEFIKLCKEVVENKSRYRKDEVSTMISYIIGRKTVSHDTFLPLDVSVPYEEFLKSL